jgi:hypothetical protein
MNPALLYRHNGRSIFWVAFVGALAIHIGAVAFAKSKLPTSRLEDFSPPGAVVVDIVETEPGLEESVTTLPLEEIHPDQDSFTEELRTPPPVRAHKKARPVSTLRGVTQQGKGPDVNGYRADFIELVRRVQMLKSG